MDEEEFIATFNQRMHAHRLWQHLFLVEIQRNPTYAMLQQWAVQAGKIDEVFAEILQNMLSNPSLPLAMRPPLEKNLDDERGNGNPSAEHFTLFRNVLSLIGVSEQKYREIPMTYGTSRIITSLRKASRGDDLVHILSLMASEESICPKEFPPFLAALSQYGSATQLTYFPVHIEADALHAQDLIRMCYSAAQGRIDGISRIFTYQQEDLTNNVLFYDALMNTTRDR